MSDVNAVPTGDNQPTGGVDPELPVVDPVNPGADPSGNPDPTPDPAPVDPAPTDPPADPAPDPVNKRFSEVTKQRDEAQKLAREANENLRRALEALERANGGKKVEPTAETPPVDDIGEEPTPPDFEDPDQYKRDMALYTQKLVERTTKLQIKATETARQTKAAEEANRAAQIAHAQAWNARRAKALEEMPDYVEIAENNEIHISQTMAVAITSSDHGPKIAYHLGQHPEVAERISKMQPVMQLIELGKLEAQITAPKPPKTSKAPPPIRHQTGSGSPQAKSLDDMSMEEYAAHRSKH